MSFKVYNKKGKLSYRENKIVKEIQDAVLKKYGDNPVAINSFRAANSPEELKELHLKYCSTEVDYEELPEEKKEVSKELTIEEIDTDHKNFRDNMTVEKSEFKELGEDSTFIDPFNDANPIVRDYVTDVKLEKDSEASSSGKSEFAEPTTFNGAFTMPGDITPGAEKKEKKDPKKEEPINPGYNDQSNGRKKRTNKKFAKYIVEAVCMLAERGFIWWTTKDITEAKVAEYELNGEIDLTILLSMPQGQQATVKEWFKQQCMTSEQLAKFDPKEKEDLAEVLAELLDKKGVSPTIEQEVAIIALKMFGEKFMIALDMKRGINSIIEQLKELNKNEQSSSARMEQQKAMEQEPEPKKDEKNFSEVVNLDDKHTVVAEIEGNFPGMTDIEDAVEVK